jgi:cytosine/adenosine deaminase-related metal-dependent hydrolase
MKRFAAQYVITNSGPVLKRAVIEVGEDGRILNIYDTQGKLDEIHSVEFYNGIIIPGFVNCHCHLELSHMKKMIPEGEGLGNFIMRIRSARVLSKPGILKSAQRADAEMYKNGISLCADICNTTETFNIKKKSRVRYINLVEVFGIDPSRAARRMDEALDVCAKAVEMELPYSLVPHSAYSVSPTLFRLIRNVTGENRVTSMHFMETQGEKELLENQSGSLRESYEKSGLMPSSPEFAPDHASAVLKMVTSSGNLMLVHNTFTDEATIEKVNERGKVFWCICPNSNLYIERTLPPVSLLMKKGCDITIGTDSLASNKELDILGEMVTLQENFSELTVEELVRWATINGARALAEDNRFGKIEKDKKPGLLLLQNLDLLNMKLTPDSTVTRLI